MSQQRLVTKAFEVGSMSKANEIGSLIDALKRLVNVDELPAKEEQKV